MTWVYQKFNEKTGKTQIVVHAQPAQETISTAYKAGKLSCYIEISGVRFIVFLEAPMRQEMEDNKFICHPVFIMALDEGRVPSHSLPPAAGGPAEPGASSSAPTGAATGPNIAHTPSNPCHWPPYLHQQLEQADPSQPPQQQIPARASPASTGLVSALPFHPDHFNTAIHLPVLNLYGPAQAASSAPASSSSAHSFSSAASSHSSTLGSSSSSKRSLYGEAITPPQLSYELQFGRMTLAVALLYHMQMSEHISPNFLKEYLYCQAHDPLYEEILNWVMCNGGLSVLQTAFDQIMAQPSNADTGLVASFLRTTTSDSSSLSTSLPSTHAFGPFIKVLSYPSTDKSPSLTFHRKGVQRAIFVETTFSVQNITSLPLMWRVMDQPTADAGAFFSLAVLSDPNNSYKQYLTSGIVEPGASITFTLTVSLLHSHRLCKLVRVAFSSHVRARFSHPELLDPFQLRSIQLLTCTLPLSIDITSLTLSQSAVDTSALSASLSQSMTISPSEISSSALNWEQRGKNSKPDGIFFGQHSFGDIILDQLRGLPVILKQWRTEGNAQKIKMFRMVEKESLLAFGDHFLPFVGVVPDMMGLHSFLVYKAPESSRLERYYQSTVNSTTSELWSRTILPGIALQIARAVLQMHKVNLVHADLKSLNCYIDFTRAPIVRIDRASSSVKKHLSGQNQQQTVRLGSRFWIAPEMANHHQYEKPIDVFSFGLVMYELAARSYPERDDSQSKSGFAPPFPSSTHPDLHTLYKQCTHVDPASRPTMQQVVAELERIDNKLHSYAPQPASQSHDSDQFQDLIDSRWF
jgi:hypothetical protein